MDDSLKPVLTALRTELNHLNTLNVIVHKYQGDFSISQEEANQLVEGAMYLYMEHLKRNVEPAFVALGRALVEAGVAFPEALDPTYVYPDGYYAMHAREWYQANYTTGVMW